MHQGAAFSLRENSSVMVNDNKDYAVVIGLQPREL
jgi:hypothetical protein